MSPIMTTSRRAFLGTAGLLILKPDLVHGSQNNSTVRMALFGCGGRGTGVAESFTEHTSAQYVALGDLFQAQTEKAKQTLDKASLKAGKAEIDSSKLFYGPDSLDKLCASKDIDVIHIATPPYFHPDHFAKAAASGKHIYCEKPVAVDVPGARRVIATGEKVGKKASVAIGFQLRHATPYVQLAERIRKGQLGDVVCGLSNYYASAIDRPEWPDASPNERRLRNWIYDKVLSGDILVEQNIHLIDYNNWILGAHPVKVSGTCGRKGRKDHGDCSSHFNVTYTYPGGIDVTITSTQFIEGAWDVAMRFFGTKGNSLSKYDAPVNITGLDPWEYPGLGDSGQVKDVAKAAAGAFKGALDDADAMKEQHFIESITSCKFINEAAQGAESTLTAILGRYAAYTGRTWKWEELANVTEVWNSGLNVGKL
jgi:myo-inositol 2-dehydrogenase / D-chiro-inositol 1-dehydrogenase